MEKSLAKYTTAFVNGAVLAALYFIAAITNYPVAWFFATLLMIITLVVFIHLIDNEWS